MDNEPSQPSSAVPAQVYLRFVFWSLFVVAIDWRIGRADILFDPLGYFCLALACRGLSGVADGFRWASILAWGLVVLGLFMEILFLNRAGVGFGLGYVLYFAISLLDGASIWFLMGGIHTMAVAQGRHALAAQAIQRRWIYAGALGVAGFMVVLRDAVGPALDVFVIICVIGTLVALGLVMYTVHRARVGFVSVDPTPTPAMPTPPASDKGPRETPAVS